MLGLLFGGLVIEVKKMARLELNPKPWLDIEGRCEPPSLLDRGLESFLDD